MLIREVCVKMFIICFCLLMIGIYFKLCFKIFCKVLCKRVVFWIKKIFLFKILLILEVLLCCWFNVLILIKFLSIWELLIINKVLICFLCINLIVFCKDFFGVIVIVEFNMILLIVVKLGLVCNRWFFLMSFFINLLVGWCKILFGVLNWIILFLFIMVILFVNFNVLFILWVIKIIVFFKCFCKFFIKFCNELWVIGFKVLKGLFIRIIFWLVVKVCIMLIFCCCFLESLLG